MEGTHAAPEQGSPQRHRSRIRRDCPDACVGEGRLPGLGRAGMSAFLAIAVPRAVQVAGAETLVRAIVCVSTAGRHRVPFVAGWHTA